jgi:tetratricopeptide (TPR) repeat protein
MLRGRGASRYDLRRQLGRKPMFTPFIYVWLVALTPASGVNRQTPDPGASAYRQLVSDYRHQVSSSVQRALTFQETDIRSSTDEAIDAAAMWPADDLRAAAMLHTDACAELLRSGQSASAFVHLNAAMRLINQAALIDVASRRFASAWYSSMASMLSKLEAPVWVKALTERRQIVVPITHAEELFQRGLDQEVTACEVSDAVVADGFGMKASRSLHSAASLFADALGIDPALHGAALHLGRVRLLQGSFDQARQLLELGTRSALANERYLALLYLGAIAERAGALGEAEARYRAALAEFKWGQSGPLALARLLSRTNRDGEARDVVAALTGRDGRTLDPLWTYLARTSQESTLVLDVLRAEVWQ